MLSPDSRGEVGLLTKTPEKFVSNLPDLYLDIASDGVVQYRRFHGGADAGSKTLIRHKAAAREGGST